MLKSAKNFLIVDDDPLNNTVTNMVLRKTLGEIDVKIFLVPEVALEFIKTEYGRKTDKDITILLLDINMPTLTGWEFLEVFKTFAERIKNQFKIYILSSSIDPEDIERAKSDPLVIDFIEKPLSRALIRQIFG